MSAFDQHIGDLHAVAALAETDGWLADERWVRTQTLREAVRIYRHVRAAGLASLDDLTVALDITLLELVRARPEPGSGLDRAQEAALHAITAVVDGMRLLPDAQPIVIRLLDDADFDAQPGPRGQRAENGRVVVPLVAHVNSEHRRGGDRP